MKLKINQEMKKKLINMLFAVGCLILYFFFPVGNLKFEIFVGTMVFLILLPILYTKLIIHKTYKDIGFTSLRLNLNEIFYLISSIVIGGLLSFVVVSTGLGVEKYLEVLSGLVLIHFGAFAIYELVFVSSILFLFTFFTWGFVYSIKCQKKIASYVIALLMFIVLLTSFYGNFLIILPLLVPTVFVRQIRDEKNIIYMFIAIFVIALILDTLLIKTFS